MNELIFLALFQTATLTLDGATTLWNPYPEKYTVIETGPARPFIGKYPTWESMAPWGIAEVVLCTSMSYILKKKNIKRWYIPQLCVSSIHLGFAARNIKVTMEWKK